MIGHSHRCSLLFLLLILQISISDCFVHMFLSCSTWEHYTTMSQNLTCWSTLRVELDIIHPCRNGWNDHQCGCGYMSTSIFQVLTREHRQCLLRTRQVQLVNHHEFSHDIMISNHVVGKMLRLSSIPSPVSAQGGNSRKFMLWVQDTC